MDINDKIDKLNINNYANNIDDICRTYEYLKNKEKISKTTMRRYHGIYYTRYKLAYNIIEKTLKSNPKNIYDLAFFEPCVGLGVFVITYIEYVIKNYQLNSAQVHKLLNNIYIADIDKESIKLCKKIISKYVKIRLNINFNLPNKNIYNGNIDIFGCCLTTIG